MNNILKDCQHRFWAKRLTESQLILSIYDLTNSLDKCKSDHAVVLDFAKAFDKVPYRRLLAEYYYNIMDSMANYSAGLNLFSPNVLSPLFVKENPQHLPPWSPEFLKEQCSARCCFCYILMIFLIIYSPLSNFSQMMPYSMVSLQAIQIVTAYKNT